ncbi:hypothetical protein HQ47_04035 [Porphyromonas macacae]|uniref:Colicin V production protein n=1 Tax=Porphyromonas macacae TaxID=28115 RepID=A0A0A2EBP9_9PORP|nr:CvpA family protein [Porphyromonas macacae]KGN75082.1 hypothetical protein HQ47_04035 [Porphyromonas macacae]
MNWLDLLIIIIVGISVFRGLIKGLLKISLFVAGFVIGVRESWRLVPYISDILVTRFNIESVYLNYLSYALAFLGIMCITWIISLFINKLSGEGILNLINRLLGGLCGFIISVLLIGYLGFLIDKIYPIGVPSRTTAENTKNKSAKPVDARLQSELYPRIQSFVRGLELDTYMNDWRKNSGK